MYVVASIDTQNIAMCQNRKKTAAAAVHKWRR